MAILLVLLFASSCPTDGGEPNGDLGPPAINITQGNANVPPGIATVDFGDTAVGGDGTELNFTIENEGPGKLEIDATDGFKITGDDDALFSLDAPPDTVVAAGQSTVFTIIFTPDSTGEKSANVTLKGTHPDFRAYTFELTGNGIAPTITIVRGSQSVGSGNIESFGAVCVGTQNDLTFVLGNTGNSDLHLLGSPEPLALDGTDPSAFTIVTQPAISISPEYETLFVLRFVAVEAGGKNAILTIENNDPDAPDFSITIEADGIVPVALLPETGYWLNRANYDDAYYKMGVAWPIPRFTDNGNETITDNLTGLVWDQNGNRFGQRTWPDALSDISSLSLGGFSDWRMPNMVEMRSLVNVMENDSAAWLENQDFVDVQSSPNTVNYYYWISTHSGVGYAYMF